MGLATYLRSIGLSFADVGFVKLNAFFPVMLGVAHFAVTAWCSSDASIAAVETMPVPMEKGVCKGKRHVLAAMQWVDGHSGVVFALVAQAARICGISPPFVLLLLMRNGSLSDLPSCSTILRGALDAGHCHLMCHHRLGGPVRRRPKRLPEPNWPGAKGHLQSRQVWRATVDWAAAGSPVQHLRGVHLHDLLLLRRVRPRRAKAPFRQGGDPFPSAAHGLSVCYATDLDMLRTQIWLTGLHAMVLLGFAALFPDTVLPMLGEQLGNGKK